jgi:hypothetical protein
MSTVEEIESAIQKLPEKDVWRLDQWLAEHKARLWDKQIEEDANAGRLDKLWQEAKRDMDEGKTRPLDEFLDNP